MKIFKFNQYIKESLSNYSLKDIPNGEYKGSIKGYDVYIDSIDSGFKTLTGYRNMNPLPVYVIVDNGSAVVYSKQGVLFTDEKTKEEYLSKYKSIDNDKNFSKYRELLNEAHVTPSGKLDDIDFDEEEIEYLSKTVKNFEDRKLHFPINYLDARLAVDRIEHESKKLKTPLRKISFAAFDGRFFRDVFTINVADEYIYEATMFTIFQNNRFYNTKAVVMRETHDPSWTVKLLFINGHYVEDKNLVIKKENIDFDEDLGNIQYQYNNQIIPKILEKACSMSYVDSIKYINDISEKIYK